LKLLKLVGDLGEYFNSEDGAVRSKSRLGGDYPKHEHS
jgi:hypothetical protein